MNHGQTDSIITGRSRRARCAGGLHGRPEVQQAFDARFRRRIKNWEPPRSRVPGRRLSRATTPPRQVVGKVPRSGIERARRKARYFKPKYRRGHRQCPSCPRHDPGSPGAVFPDAHRKSRHRQFTPLHGVRTNCRRHFQHLLPAGGSFLGARSVGPHAKHREGQQIRGSGQCRRSGERSPVGPSRPRRRLL